MPRDPERRPGGSPRKRERNAARERGETYEGISKDKEARRRILLTPERHARVIALLRLGNYLETAAAAVGVTRDTLRAWMDRGAKEEAHLQAGGDEHEEELPYLCFQQDVLEAIAEAEARDVAAITQAGTDTDTEQHEYDENGKLTKRVVRRERGDWRARAWRLEHMHGDKYTQKIKVEVEAQLSQVLDFLEQNVSPDAFRQVVEALSKRT